MPHYALLLHGVHMHAWSMLPFARLLKANDIEASVFGYYSVTRSIDAHCRALAQRVEAHYRRHDEPLHLVGHSLGGLVLRHFAAQYPELVRGRIVTLGTPHQGSCIAPYCPANGCPCRTASSSCTTPALPRLPIHAATSARAWQ